jgi:DNA polymerase-3 subunit delta
MITTLNGSNSFMLQQALNELIGHYVGQFGELGLEKLDGEESSAERLIEATGSLPFLVAQKLLILRNPGVQKVFAEQIENLIKAVPEGVNIIIVEPKIDKRSSYYKVLKSKTEYREFNELDGHKLSTWIIQYVKQQGGSISSNDARYLLERVGQNQQFLYHELGKLLAYSPQIARSNIDLLTEPAPQSTVFELIDSAFAGNNKKTLELYKQQRLLKVEPQQIMAMIAWQLHVLAVIKVAGNKTADEIAREAKLNPYVVRKSSVIANKISLYDTKKLIKRALKLDIRMKTQNIDADEALQHFLLTIS